LRGVRAGAPLIFNWINVGVGVVTAVIFFSTLSATADVETWKWVLLFVLPLVVAVVTLLVAVLDTNRNPREIQMALAPILHIFCAALFYGCYHGFLHKGAEALIDGQAGDFTGWMVLWLVILIVVWVITALILWAAFHSFNVNPAAPDTVNGLVGEPAFLRLYDDTTLFRQKM